MCWRLWVCLGGPRSFGRVPVDEGYSDDGKLDQLEKGGLTDLVEQLALGNVTTLSGLKLLSEISLHCREKVDWSLDTIVRTLRPIPNMHQ